MKPYGLSRFCSSDLDVAGILEYGRASRYGKLPGPSGAIRAMQKPASKAASRRHLKRLARLAGRREIVEALS